MGFERESERFKRERWVGRWRRLREKKGGESGWRRQPLSTLPRAVVGGRAQIREREMREKGRIERGRCVCVRERGVSKVSKHIWRLGPLLVESSSPAIVCTASSDGGFRATMGSWV